MREVPRADMVRTLHAAGASGNVAVSTLHLEVPPARALSQVVAAVTVRPRWALAGTQGEVAWLTHRTRLFRFVDDVYLLAEAEGSGTRLLLRSASRVGRDDLGQNARNLGELERALRSVLEVSPP